MENYLWHAGYEELNYNAAKRYFEKHSDPVAGACSAVRKGDLVLGTFDWSRETGTTWQTVHAAIYDLAKLEMTLFLQEGNTKRTFKIWGM